MLLLRIVNHSTFTKTVIGLILFNAVLVGLETYPSLYVPFYEWFYFADRILLWLFTLEIVLRILAKKPPYHFFKDGWNIFDFVIVMGGHLFVGGHFLTVLRILRILRVLRVISVIPSLRRMINALLLTIPAMGNILLLLGMFFYIYAVMGTFLFARIAPEYFGSLHSSIFTLFQVVTLESWASGVARPILAEAEWAWLYFVTFILIGTFVIFNLFVGVIVNNVDKANEEDEIEENRGKGVEVLTTQQELAALRQEISELKTLILQSRKADAGK
jgi:voltage-gated sodium channel